MKTEPQRTCPSCGNEFSGAMEFCPVCMLRKGLAGGIESGESSFREAIKPTPDQSAQRFEHYELVTGEDGKLVELGRGSLAEWQTILAKLRRAKLLAFLRVASPGDRRPDKKARAR